MMTNVVGHVENVTNESVNRHQQCNAVAIDIYDESFERQPIFRKALRTFLIILQAFGLYYDLSRFSASKRSTGIIIKTYCFVIVLLILAALVRSVVAFFYMEPNDDIFFAALLLVFMIKCSFQSLACIQLSPITCSARLWDFIQDLEQFLCQIKLKNCCTIEKKFMKKIKIWLYVFLITFVTSFTVQGAIVVNNYILHNNATNTEMSGLVTIQKQMSTPLPNRIEYFIFMTIVNAYCFGAWFLPAALCGILSQCVSYAYGEFYRYLYTVRDTKSKYVCVKAYASYIRKQCFTLRSLVNELDDMVKNIYLISFSLDIVLICINLRVAIFSLSDLPSRLFIGSWMINPVFTLIALSLTSAQIVERGEEMNAIVESFQPRDVSPDLQVEIQLLMFHLQTKPAAMSIYGMIPLHRSIIISIFVSIVTYFTLLVTL